MSGENEISKIDKNFTHVTSDGELLFYDVNKAPFRVYGLLWEDGTGFTRMPSDIAGKVSDGVFTLAKNTAGGRVRFSTDSSVIAVRCRIPQSWRMAHMTDAGSAGFDLYNYSEGKQRFVGAFIPQRANTPEYELTLKLATSEMRDFVLDMPLFSSLSSLEIGLQKGSALNCGSEYKHKKPLVFYGSSITHGACASRPGLCYEAIISRRLDTDFVNLGFSGGAKGEDTVMTYIAGLDMSMFVYDYDYNAPSAEHLMATHYKGYRKVRDSHPDIPIIMASSPNFSNPARDGKARRDVIAATYEKALSEGDKNVYFVDGEKEFATFFDDGRTVDGTHPNDVGFEIMAKAFGDIAEKLIK